MRVKLLLFTFYLNGGLHSVSIGKPSERVSNFWTVRFLKTEYEPNFGFLHIPTGKSKILLSVKATQHLTQHCVSKNEPTLAISSFVRHRLTIIFFGKQHQHTFKIICISEFPSPFTFTYFICF